MKYRIIVDKDGDYVIETQHSMLIPKWCTVSIHKTKQQATTIMDELVASDRAAKLKNEAYDKLVAEGRHIVAEETV